MVSKKLATDAMLDEVLCVCSGRWAVKTCTEGLAYKGPSCGVVTTETGMNFSQELPPFFLGDTSLKYSGSAFLVKFSLVDFLGFRAPHNAACLILILRKFSPIKVGQEGFGPWGDTAMMRWANGLISVAEPPMMSVCLDSGVVFGSRFVVPLSPCHTTDGLKSLSKKMLGGTGSRLVPMRARTSTA